MALPEFSMRQLLEAGAHFGHQTHRWNPKMERFIFGSRSNIHIIDLSQTMPLLHQALWGARRCRLGRAGAVRRHQAPGVGPGGRAAKRCAQYYVNHRWLGGTLTNWRTISQSIARLRELEGVLEFRRGSGLHQEGAAAADPRAGQARAILGGIKDMGGIPDLIFVIDTNKEAIAIQEARKLNIPVVAILDTNCDPQGITFRSPAMTTPPARSALLRPDRRGGDRRDFARPGRTRGRYRRRREADRGGAGADGAGAGDLGFEPLPGPRGVADDLKKLSGVSPAIEKKLNDLGIFHYSQIAELNETAAHNIGEEVGLPGRVPGVLYRQGQDADGGSRIAASPARDAPCARGLLETMRGDRHIGGDRCIARLDGRRRRKKVSHGKYHRFDGQGVARVDRRRLMRRSQE